MEVLPNYHYAKTSDMYSKVLLKLCTIGRKVTIQKQGGGGVIKTIKHANDLSCRSTVTPHILMKEDYFSTLTDQTRALKRSNFAHQTQQVPRNIK